MTAQKYAFKCINRCRCDFNIQVWGFLIITKYFTKNQSCTAQKLFLWKMFSSAPSKRISCGLQWKMKLIISKTFYLVDKIKAKKYKLSIHWWKQTNFRLFHNTQYGCSIPSLPWSDIGTVKEQRRKING